MRFIHKLLELGKIALGILCLKDLRLRAFALDRGGVDVLVLLVEPHEEGGDLRGGAVGREEPELLDIGALLAEAGMDEDILHVLEGGRAFADGLVLVSQEHEVGT